LVQRSGGYKPAWRGGEGLDEKEQQQGRGRKSISSNKGREKARERKGESTLDKGPPLFGVKRKKGPSSIEKGFMTSPRYCSEKTGKKMAIPTNRRIGKPEREESGSNGEGVWTPMAAL